MGVREIVAAPPSLVFVMAVVGVAVGVVVVVAVASAVAAPVDTRATYPWLQLMLAHSWFQ